MNFVPKVKDMSVFNIPDQCKKDDNLLVPAVSGSKSGILTGWDGITKCHAHILGHMGCLH